MNQGKWEPLSPEISVLTTAEHTFNTDTILLASFAAPKSRELCADFGTGCGTIPLWWAARSRPARIWQWSYRNRPPDRRRSPSAATGWNR